MASKYQDVLRQHSIPWEENTHTEAELLKADLVIKSPGIPDTVPLVVKMSELGIPIISEIEFASRFTRAVIVGITGSNGKTTTALLTHHLLKNGDLNVALGGNIGNSFAGLVASENPDYYVLELSSFQLDGIHAFKPHIAVITNITPDHLDRYNNDFK
jgi:UDP-N-acetylmuramoylalanine--D-glutamate ligase